MWIVDTAQSLCLQIDSAFILISPVVSDNRIEFNYNAAHAIVI